MVNPTPNPPIPPPDPIYDPAEGILIDGPEPTDAALDAPDIKKDLEQPEHKGDALGDFGETVIDKDGELEPEILDEPGGES